MTPCRVLFAAVQDAKFIGKISGRRIFYAAESFERDTDRWSKTAF